MSDRNSWKSLKDLREPFNDAFNYRSRIEKELFNKLFLRTDALERCLSPSTYFLMGEKGSGKTAYAVYLENNSVEEHRCQVTTMTETQYKRFIQLKKSGKLAYSDYANIWRSMLLFLVGRLVVSKSKGILSSITGKFRQLEAEIAKWSKNALNPEIESAFRAVTSKSFGAALGEPEIAQVTGTESSSITEDMPVLRHHLLDAESAIKSALSSLSLANNHILFIDGIDYRPEGVSYKEYLECVKGLAEAVWQLNTEYFNNIRDSRGRIKIVLLVRPDVFHALNLYNSNSRLQDNTIYLDWATTEQEYRQSPLYEVSGRYFSRQQLTDPSPASAWEHYYQDDKAYGATFKRLLRQTFQKPRDILTFIKITRDLQIRSGFGDNNQFPLDIYSKPQFTRAFSDYLLGETRNYAAFYMTQEDFRSFMKYFQFLDGKNRFSFTEFADAFNRFNEWISGEDIRAREIVQDPESLLQFFYDVNVIGYSEQTQESSETYHHWSFRERSLNDIAPKVKATEHLTINPGIAKALDIGKSFRAKDERERAPRKKRRGGRNSNRKGSR